ncbi:MAG TPA: hypothetical protein VFU02_25175, partial [Polyangiaceae bacterium]|nr:hypothetical protein [Polyangiaceae bacterium]
MSTGNDRASTSSAVEQTQRTDSSLPSTSWTIVRAAGGSDPVRAHAALVALVELYRGPVGDYLLHCGYTDDEAEALAKRFFADLGGAKSLASAADGKQPFRVWLLEALEDFLSSDPDPTRPCEPAGAASNELDELP